MNLAARIRARQSEFLLSALTPPRLTVTREQAGEIAGKARERLSPLGLDGLVQYDIDDESARNPDERPFPFLPTIDPATFLAQHLQDGSTPVVVYRAVSKHGEGGLLGWLQAQNADRALTVLVGAPSRHRPAATSLVRAQELEQGLHR